MTISVGGGRHMIEGLVVSEVGRGEYGYPVFLKKVFIGH